MFSRFRSVLSAVFLTAGFVVASSASADVIWFVGKGSATDAKAVSEMLGTMLNERTIPITEGSESFAAWVYAPDTDGSRAGLLSKASAVLVSPPAGEPPAYTLMACLALKEELPSRAVRPVLVSSRERIYGMRGLRTATEDIALAGIADSVGYAYAPLPKVWERVYTDDLFYDGRLTPKDPATEAYIQAAGLCLTLRGQNAPLPRLAGVPEDLADDLIASIRAGFAMREKILYGARRVATGKYPVRPESSFSAVLYDGAFEHAVGDWLQRIAAADRRKLSLYYTTETTLNTGWPCLFRTTQKLGDAPKATVYTRPAFSDNTGLQEQTHLGAILARDAGRKGYLPFQIAVAEHLRKFPGVPVYDGEVPTQPIAAMFASMLWIEWTGAVVIPEHCTPPEAHAVNIGISVILRMKTLRKNVNAVLCRPSEDGHYRFSLWAAPANEVTLRVAVLGGEANPDTLKFSRRDFWTWKTVSAGKIPEGGPEMTRTFHWKTEYPMIGQSIGARNFGPGPEPAPEAEADTASEPGPAESASAATVTTDAR